MTSESYKNRRAATLRLCYAAAMLALGYILPRFFGSTEMGTLFSPMHIPVLIAGIVCGPAYGALIGAVLPLTSMLFFGSPPVFIALPMSFELAAYGAVSGMIFRYLPRFIKNVHADIIARSYISLISAMILGRAVYGVVMIKAITLNPYIAEGSKYSISILWTDTVANAWVGIIIQILIIPSIVYALFRAKLLPNYKNADNQPVR